MTERISIEARGVVVDEQRFPGRQGRLVFAYLLAAQGRPVPRDELVDALWGDEPPARWGKALSVLVSKLRALLNERGIDGSASLTSAFGCYQLTLPAGSWIDFAAADVAATAAERDLATGDLGGARTNASTAESLARRTFLPGEDGRWVEERRAELREILVRALDCLAEANRRSGDPAAAVRAADELITLEPFRERGYRLLMQAQSAAGNDAEALRTYERCRKLLAEELGAYPSPETESIYRGLLEAPATRAGAAAAFEAPPPDPRHDDLEGEPEGGLARRLASRKRVGTATLTVALTATAVGGFLATRGGDTHTTAVSANAVGLVDARGDRVRDEVAVDAAPTSVAYGAGAVWVTSASANTVSRIDPETRSVRQTVPVGHGPSGIAVGGGAVWVANGLDGTVSRIDPTTNQVVQTVPVGNGPSGVAFGAGAIWVTNSADGTVSQIDADTGWVTRTLPAVIGASGVAVGFRRIWVVSPSSASVVALDPGSGRVLKRIGVGGEPNAIAAGEDAVWVANRADDTVSKIDPQTTTVTDTIQVGRGPEGIAAGPEGVWLANRVDGTLIRLDPSSGDVVKTVRLGNSPRGVALTPEGVFVAVQSTGLEHRGGTLKVLSAFGPDSIDPALAGFRAASVLLVTNDGLVSFRKVGGVEGTQLVPDLAVALPVPTDGGKTYTFQVRAGIHYSNGKLVQPDDFKRAIERLFVIGATEATGFYSGIVGADRCVAARSCDLDEGVVTDRAARTVTIRISAPDADFLAKLALPFVVAVPAGTPARDVGTRPIPATGPYRIATFGKKGKTLRLVRNQSFREWSAVAQPQGFPDAISFSWRVGLDTAARVRAVERGAADVALSDGPPLSKQELDALAVRYPSRLHVNTLLGTFFFFLNTRVSPFDDVRMRRAVNIAFDRETFTRLLGRAFAPTCQILPPNLPAYRRTCPYRSSGVAGLQSARRLVASSGAAGTRVTVWAPSPIAEQGRYMVSVLTSLGFRARLKTVNHPDAYFKTVSDSRVRAQAGWGAWLADVPSVAGFVPGLLSCAAFVPASPGQANLAEFCDPSIDAQIARAAAAQVQDPAAATTLWQEVERSLLGQAPLVPAYNRSNIDFVSKRAGNYQYNPQWGVLLDQLWVR